MRSHKAPRATATVAEAQFSRVSAAAQGTNARLAYTRRRLVLASRGSVRRRETLIGGSAVTVAKCDSEGASIVLLGSFNPGIFQPAWFGAHELIKPEESESAKINVIHPEVSAFATDWFSIQVLKERFTVQASDPGHYSPLADLVLGLFQLLEHTPFDKMGLNRFLHFRMASEDEWHRVGDLLAPKEPWRAILKKPGLRSLYMQDAPEETTSEGAGVKVVRFVRIEPSQAVHPGVFVEVNRHHETSGTDAARVLMKVLRDTWRPSLDEAQRVAEHLVTQASER